MEQGGNNALVEGRRSFRSDDLAESPGDRRLAFLAGGKEEEEEENEVSIIPLS